MRRLLILTGTSALAMLFLVAASQPTHVAAGSTAKTRGAELFASTGCAHCHGPAGVGGGLGPDLQLLRKRMDKQAIAHQIHDGGKGMPAFGDQLSEADLKDLVAFLSAKRPLIVPPPPSEAAPAHPSAGTGPASPPHE
jgi:mono/diheme cytochrome c family protein